MTELMSKQGDELLLNMGPHHPSTHGVLRFVLHTDGEIMNKAVPDVGFLHRGMEKAAERQLYSGWLPFADRVNYLECIFAQWSYCLAVEKLAGIVVPPRGEWLRLISGELNRILSHFIGLGTTAMDIGATTPFLQLLAARERGNDLMEALTGQRLTYNYLRLGGVAHDAEDGWLKQLEQYIATIDPIIDEFNDLITGNEIFVNRMANVGVISKEDAIGFGLVGPNVRASGHDWDLRRDMPYSVYPEVKFDVPVGRGFKGQLGDSFDRFWLRALEVRESVKIIKQALSKLPAGEFKAKVNRTIKVPAGEAYGCVEGARGELGYYVIADGTDKPYRLKIRSGSWAALSIIEHVSPGLMIADLVALIATLDVLAPETDR